MCYSGQEALEEIRREKSDLAILDIMMPGMSGLAVCREIRKKDTYPVIFLIAKGEEIDKINGLSLNVRTHQCTLGRKDLKLTPTEFSVLEILCWKKGSVVSSEELFHCIRHLREKMGYSIDHPGYIKTVWGCGYKIEEQ